MVQRPNRASVFIARSEFDEFLFARVGEEANGMTLSVLSLLARAGFDPWQQAAELARLPDGIAVDTLGALIAALIAALPADAADYQDIGMMATRLISLLPGHHNGTGSQQRVSGRHEISVQAIATGLLIIAFLLAAGWMVANWDAPAHAAEETQMLGAPTSSRAASL